jgi:2-dehydro-3-deoxygalactonokinase
MSPAQENQAVAFIAVDWGTSNARFALCDEDGQALEIRKGPGAVESNGRFADVFDAQTAEWRKAHGELPTYMCGMVGSAIGWVEAPYLPAPADLHELADSPVRVRDGIHVVRGMRCTNPLGAPDVMRGEETQLFGALHLGELGNGHRIVCMPGTHTKWAAVANQSLQEFLTAPTGEVFATLTEHTVLIRDKSTPVTHVPEDFERGLAEATKHRGMLLHQIFQARSLRLDKQLSPQGAESWISGLLIGADVHGALSLMAEHDASQPVLVIGTPQLTASYAKALARAGRQAVQLDGSMAALAGLGLVFREQEMRS